MTSKSNVTCPSTEERLRAHTNTVTKRIWTGQNKQNLAYMGVCSAVSPLFHKALEEKFTAWMSQKNLPGGLMDLFTNQS